MKLDISNIKLNESQEQEFDYKATFNKCFVDINKPLERPPIVLGIGYHDYKGVSYLNPTFTKGELSAIIAPQKSKKTFFKRSLIASYIGGSTNHYFPNITTKIEGEPYILDFDTEQGGYYAQRSFKGVSEMVGTQYKNYLPFSLKALTDDERVQFIDAVVNDPKYKGKIGWISIDGIADLCLNTNDIEKSKEIAQKIMTWNEGCHVQVVIHKTFDKDKATGHLGSFLQKKAETTIFLKDTDRETKNSPIEVKQYDSRGAPFDKFYFDLDLNTVIPKECDEPKW